MSAAMYKKLKKQNGEKFAQTVRNFHSGLLEIPELDVILRHAGRNAQPLLPYLMTLMASNDDDEVAPAEPQDPFELLDQAGYDAFHADTLKKQNSIKPYFRKGELLCTFNDKARYKNYHIVNAIKKNVDEIKRAENPEREDEYGTSVISIQMAKRGGFISIKNRYNHTVTGCDNTFNSNPDNIIRGLSTALKEHFDVEFSATKSPLPVGYTLIGNRIFKYNEEYDNIYYGDQAWAKDGEIHVVDKSAGDALFDRFLFENKTKTIRNIEPDNPEYGIDSFPEDFNRVYGGNRGLNVQKGNLMLDGDILIGAEESKIKTLYLPELDKMGGNFLRTAEYITSCDVPAVTEMAPACLVYAESLTHLNIPAVIEMGYSCLCRVRSLKRFDAQSLVKMGSGSLGFVGQMEHFNAPALKRMPSNCMRTTPRLKTFNAPVLKCMGKQNLNYAPELRELNVPALNKAGKDCFISVPEAIKREIKHLLDPPWVQDLRLRFEARDVIPIVEYTPHI